MLHQEKIHFMYSSVFYEKNIIAMNYNKRISFRIKIVEKEKKTEYSNS